MRGIIQRSGMLLMIYSMVQGDYKFPGGGLHPGETRHQALEREILEETGARLLAAPAAFGKVIEIDQPLEPHYDVFRMTSYYYTCRVDSELRPQKLDAYEKDLDYRAVWVPAEEAWQNNLALLAANMPGMPRWAHRETFVLELLKSGGDESGKSGI